MNRLLLATRSPDKAREIRHILEEAGAGVELVSLDDARVAFSTGEDRIEEHDTFQGNARAKAEYFCKLTGLPTVADDSGIEVIALLGKPGVRSRRFAYDATRLSGAELDRANNAELLRRLQGADPARRRACYVCVAVLVRRPGAPPESFTGRAWGRVLEQPRGSGGFGYDPLFYYPPLGATFAEMAAEAKHAVSHRGRAMARARDILLAWAARRPPDGP